MDVIERRRSKRVTVSREQVAVIHDKAGDIPAKLIDLSATGALIRFVTLSLMGEESLSDCIELSMHDESCVLQVRARIIRRGPQFIAVEFMDERPGFAERIAEKIRKLGAKSPQRAKGAHA